MFNYSSKHMKKAIIALALVIIAGCTNTTSTTKTYTAEDFNGKWSVIFDGMVQEINIKVTNDLVTIYGLGTRALPPDPSNPLEYTLSKKDSITLFCLYNSASGTAGGKPIVWHHPPEAVWGYTPYPSFKFDTDLFGNNPDDYGYYENQIRLVMGSDGKSFVGVFLAAEEGYVNASKSRKWVLRSNDAITGTRR